MRKKKNELLDSMFVDRWSPRAFLEKELNASQIDVLMEAAQWAPSCFNEQPWHFLVGLGEKKNQILSFLAEKINCGRRMPEPCVCAAN
ncbi:MAG: nitroreductase family protein [Bdellovibrionota bacterium]